MKMNSGYFIQYCPCGHVRELLVDEIELLNKAKNNPNIDAIIQSSSTCPQCKKDYQNRLHDEMRFILSD